MMLNMLALLQAQAAPPNRNLLVLVIYVVSFGAIAWFLLIRPQRKMQEKHQQMLGGMKKGDEVLTEGGIIGTIVHMQDDRVTIRSGESRLVVAKVKIARVITGGEATAEKA